MLTAARLIRDAAALLGVELKALFICSLQHLLGIQFETQWWLAPLQRELNQSDSFPEEQAFPFMIFVSYSYPNVLHL